MPVQQNLGGVTGVGGGHGQGHTMVGFVGGCVAGRGYMMSGECWLHSIYSSPVVFRAFITPSHSWMRKRESRWWKSILQEEVQYNCRITFLVMNMVENKVASKMYFNKSFNESYMSKVVIHFAAAFRMKSLNRTKKQVNRLVVFNSD